MSWMIVAQHLPLKAKRIEDIPRDFKPNPIGTRAEIAATVKAIVPTVIFAEDLVEAEFDGPGYSVELSLGEREPSLGVTFFVWGTNPAVVDVIADIIDGLGLRALHTGEGDAFFDRRTARLAFESWCKYRNQIADNDSITN
jgi:hypothetical protein